MARTTTTTTTTRAASRAVASPSRGACASRCGAQRRGGSASAGPSGGVVLRGLVRPLRAQQRDDAAELALTTDFEGINQLLQKKLAVLESLSGSDRGSAAGAEQRASVERAVDDLVSAGNVPRDTRSVQKLCDGTWRLVYSTNFGAGGAGSPNQPLFGLPSVGGGVGGGPKLGQVYQRIRSASSRGLGGGSVDNIVEFDVPVLGTVRATLAHDLAIGKGDEFKITYTGARVALGGGPGPEGDGGAAADETGNGGGLTSPTLPNVLRDLPKALRPTDSSATFTNVFVDSTLRVSKGDRGELRIYVLA